MSQFRIDYIGHNMEVDYHQGEPETELEFYREQVELLRRERDSLSEAVAKLSVTGIEDFETVRLRQIVRIMYKYLFQYPNLMDAISKEMEERELLVDNKFNVGTFDMLNKMFKLNILAEDESI